MVGLLGAITNPPKSDDKYVEKVFNWSEVHLSEMTCYKIHNLMNYAFESLVESQRKSYGPILMSPSVVKDSIWFEL